MKALRWLYRIKGHHILFWTCAFAFWVLIYRFYYGNEDIKTLSATTACYLASNAAVYYFNSQWIFSRFLFRANYFGFFCMFLATAVVAGSVSGIIIAGLQSANTFVSPSYWLVSSVVSNLSVAGLLVLLKFIVQKIKLEQQRLKTELDFLKAQINPHFLFNSINSVYVLIEDDPRRASQTLLCLSELLRFQLYDCAADEIDIESEIRYLQNYIALEKLRTANNVSINFKIEGDLSEIMLPPFLFVPFVENAFKHLSQRDGVVNEIVFALTISPSAIMFFSDNTCDADRKPNANGIGLKNIRRRLEIYFPGRFELGVNDRGTRFETRLAIHV